jgi:hypothetical protein
MTGGFIFTVHPPCLSVTCSITLIMAELFDNLRTIILENIKQLNKNPWSYTFVMNAWWFVFGTIFVLYPVLWLTLTLQFPSLALMCKLIHNYFWSQLYYKQTVVLSYWVIAVFVSIIWVKKLQTDSFMTKTTFPNASPVLPCHYLIHDTICMMSLSQIMFCYFR